LNRAGAGARVEVVVSREIGGQRLDQAMAALARELTRGEARRLVAAGAVYVDGRRTRICSRLVRPGERIHWEAGAGARAGGATAPPVHGGPQPAVVMEHADLWIVDKPAGMPVEPTRTGAVGTLAEWLRRRYGRPFVTHRLDAATSGLLVVARNAAAQAELNRLFAAHAIERRYLAAVSPAPPWEASTLEAPLDGRTAVTHARVVARAPLGALLDVALETGRTRQIRRHLGGAGFPVVGESPTGIRKGRLLLHAASLRFPWNGKTIAAAAPPPDDFLQALAALSLQLP
jgi:23S rRNA pseudouridine1911/1915/1917 synthase